MLTSGRVCALLLLPWIVACSGGESNKDPIFEAKFQNEKRIGAENVTKRQIQDAEYMVETASRKMELLEISQIAQRKAASADARYAAQNVINQATGMLNDIKSLAQQKNVVLPTGLGAKQAEQVGELTALNDAAFDQKYATLLKNVVDQDLDATDDMTTDAYNTEIRTLASRQLTSLEDLKRAAEVLRNKLNP